jgi:1-aminocyclopropane-1-carboxylate synthase
VLSKMLSSRVQDTLVPSALSGAFTRALGNAYHPTNNPDGIISLGIAENTLMYNELATFLDRNMKITRVPSLFQGLLRLYNSAPFNPAIPVEQKHLAIAAGCTAILDNLFWSLCDNGDGVLIGKPLYGGFANDLEIRSKVKLVAVSLKDYDPFEKKAVSRYEEELLNAKKKGIKVRALVLCTPHNPLGQYTTVIQS